MAENAPTSFLRKRIAGIPVLYLAGGAAVVLAVIAFRMRQSEDPSEDGVSPSTDVPTEEIQNDMVNAADGTNYDPFVAKGSITAAPADQVTPDPPKVEETNEDWLKKGVQWQINTKGQSAGVAQEALQAYLRGSQLSIAQGAIRDSTIKEFGLPPDPPDRTSTAPAPGPTLAPAKSQGPLPRYHKVINTNDDTFAKIARIYYPTYDDTSVDLLEKANVGRLANAGPFRAGTTVYVPKYNVPKYYTATEKTDTAAEIGKKHGVSALAIQRMNDGMKFPVKKGTRVRVA